MLEEIIECVTVILSLLIKLYNDEKIDKLAFREYAQVKMEFLNENYDILKKMKKEENAEIILKQCRLILNINSSDDMFCSSR
jgi:hypothetical protein